MTGHRPTITLVGRAHSLAFAEGTVHPMFYSWHQAETRRMEHWRRKQQNDIRRQLLAHDTTHFGRKRRARRARGRAAGAGG